MPPEPLPWDRKDLAFKDRKQDRITSGDGGYGGNYTPRWRASPRRPPPSYYRQNGSCYDAYSPSRSDEGFRSSYGRYNGIRIGSRENHHRSPYYDRYSPSHVTSKRAIGESRDDLRSDQIWDQDRDHSLGTIVWKPLKWTRQSLVNAEEAGNGELGVSAATSAVEKSPNFTEDSEEGAMRKKMKRLSWGQGLAKYEKQKVEGSMNSESSLKAAGAPGSMSPATPCSSAACSSPGIEDRPFSKAKETDKDTSHHSEISDLCPPNCLELPIKSDQLPLISMLTVLLNDLLQPEDACTGDSTFTRYTATSKLLLFKADISKELEKTESEIDLLENELKTLINDIRCNASQISFSLQNESSSMSCTKSAGASSKVSLDLTPIISSAMPVVKQSDLPIYSSSKHESEGKHANNDIPQAASCSNGASSSSGNEKQVPLVFGERAVAGNGSGDLNHSDGGSSSNANFIMRSHGNKDNNFIDLIIASNRDASRRASHAFDTALPTASQKFDIWGSDRILSCRKNDMQIREKLALRKRQIKFKERVLALKFRAFNHLWKEDLRLLSVRKQRTKSQKRFELCGRSSQSSMQKHRSSVRSRFTLPAGNLTLVPTADIVNYTSKLLSESQIKIYRNNLKMPAPVLDVKERDTRFINKNNLIEDLVSFEKERSMINPWTQEEKGVFMEKLATFGKDFAKISSFLSHKTTADCVEFYYKNHKSESFRDVKKQLDLHKQRRCLPTTTYMVASGKRWNRDTNAASLDMLGAVSVAVAHISDSRRNQPKYSTRSILGSYHSSEVSRGSHPSLERANSVEMSEIGKEATGTNVLAGEAVSFSATSSISPSEKMSFGRMSRPLTPEVAQTIEEEDTCSDEACGNLGSVDWTSEEKFLFIQALGMYGKDFARISHCVGTKSQEQCKTFFSKARKCLNLDQVLQGAGNGGTQVNDANGGSSDPDGDGAWAAEMDSVICSTQSCSRMDVDFTYTNTGSEVEGHNQDEIHDKVDSLRSVLNAENLETEGENLQSKCKPVPSHDDADKSVGGELGEVEKLVYLSSIAPSIASCTEGQHPNTRADSLRSVLNAEKLETEGENVQSKCKPVPSHDDADKSVGGELGEGEKLVNVSSIVPSIASCIEGQHPNTQAAAGVKIKEGELQQVPLGSKNGCGERQMKKIEREESSSVDFSLITESNVKEDDSYMASKMNNACPNNHIRNLSTHQHPVPLEPLSCTRKKSQMPSSKQNIAYSVPFSTVLPDPSSICSESFHNFDDHLHKLYQGSAPNDLYHQQYLSRINVHQIDQSSSHVINGYPLQVSNQEELKRHSNTIIEKPILHENHSSGNLSSLLNGYAVPCTDAQPTHHAGDVKLFGQILTKSSSTGADGQPLSPKLKKNSTTRTSTSGRIGSFGHSGLEDVPLRSYGYWDGKRIQTGFSSLAPESSAIMLAACQGSIVTGKPLFSTTKDVSATGISGALTSNYQQANGRNNGFELVSGFQQQRRTAMARLGVNMVVSDPVAALKMAKLWKQDPNGT